MFVCSTKSSNGTNSDLLQSFKPKLILKLCAGCIIDALRLILLIILYHYTWTRSTASCGLLQPFWSKSLSASLKTINVLSSRLEPFRATCTFIGQVSPFPTLQVYLNRWNRTSSPTGNDPFCRVLHYMRLVT